ncbi:hypothetical protein EWM64_g6139 [Hericium alpestre]|uniref:Alpha/beta hydrolase fold-3 domain-containing protein n=1 Tax=Hericium alpestre TaxID=135208 RepID=A0A4Y9ZTH4_9AGAM|nr:hypothetical protein EWM64_g6139 [Hericium alpestre]
MSQYAHLSVADPEFAEASAHLPKSDPTDDVTEMRRRFDSMVKWGHENNKLLSTPTSELRVEEHKMPVDGGEITAKCMISTPTGGSAGPFPLFVNYHGGGYVVGGLSTDEPWLRQICVEQQVSVVDVDYRLGPEFPWPYSHEDSYAALKWRITFSFMQIYPKGSSSAERPPVVASQQV